MHNNVPTISNKKIKIPQPDKISEREREDAMGAYLMMFAAVV